MWKKILAGVALAVALFLGFVALRPGHYRVERSVAVSATAADVEALIELARTEVSKRYGVELKTEVVIVGDR